MTTNQDTKHPPLIQFENVHKGFGTNQVLCGVNLSICQGMVTAIIGKSGTGKSVLLKHIIGLTQPDSGRILIKGHPLDTMPKDEKKHFRDRLSYMFQDNALFDFLTVYDNIALPLTEKKKLAGSEIDQKVKTLMDSLGLAASGNRFPNQLSGGMRKRVALARALVVNPEVVLFDEPTTGLDPVRKNSVHEMIKNYQETFGFTAVIVSHDIPDIFSVADQAAMLDKGKIIFEGTCQQMLDCQDTNVLSFIQGKDTETIRQ